MVSAAKPEKAKAPPFDDAVSVPYAGTCQKRASQLTSPGAACTNLRNSLVLTPPLALEVLRPSCAVFVRDRIPCIDRSCRADGTCLSKASISTFPCREVACMAVRRFG